VPKPRASREKATKGIAQQNRSSAKRRSVAYPQKRVRRASSLPDFTPFALCQLVDRPPNGPDWVHEIKLDGWRVQVRVEDGRATIRTRKGLDYTSTFPEIAKAARGLDNCIIDGEICAVGRDGLTDFSALQAAMKANTTDKLILFALLLNPHCRRPAGTESDHVFVSSETGRCLRLSVWQSSATIGHHEVATQGR
jgi:bifunctional non-homologous end joining protein LigD